MFTFGIYLARELFFMEKQREKLKAKLDETTNG